MVREAGVYEGVANFFIAYDQAAGAVQKALSHSRELLAFGL